MKKALMLTVPLALMILLIACQKKPQTLSDYLQMSSRTGKPVLIDFYTAW
jgi:hypothetical protein